MNGSEYKLTEEQRELVTKNHDLIYSYAHKNRISIDEYYDLLAIGLCNAARIYNNSKGKFSTLAYMCMKNELNMHWRKTKDENEAEVLSYDSKDVREDKDNQSSFLDSFADWQSCKDMSCVTFINEVARELNGKEKRIFILVLKEHTYEEIANLLDCSAQNVYYYVNNIRKRASKYLYNN